MKMAVKHLFPQIVFIRDLLDPSLEENGIDDNYARLLKRTIDEMRSVDPKGRKISNAYTGWQSVDGCDGHPAFQKLMRCIKQTFYDEVWPYWGLEKKKGHFVDLHNSWANINDKGAWNKPHKHNGCWLSGVFYIQADGDEGNFIAMSDTSKIMGDFPNSPRLNENESFEPKTGMLYIFPSGLTHMVEPNTTDKDRYSISFNMGIQYRTDDREGNHPGFDWAESLFDITPEGKLIQVSTAED